MNNLIRMFFVSSQCDAKRIAKTAFFGLMIAGIAFAAGVTFASLNSVHDGLDLGFVPVAHADGGSCTLAVSDATNLVYGVDGSSTITINSPYGAPWETLRRWRTVRLRFLTRCP